MSGPTLHRLVEDDRLQDGFEYADRSIRGLLADIGDKLHHEVQGLVREAYRRGVADGFQQGVLAKTEPADT